MGSGRASCLRAHRKGLAIPPRAPVFRVRLARASAAGFSLSFTGLFL